MIKDKIKQALASMEQVRKDLNAVDEAQAELEAVSRDRDAVKTELAEIRAQRDTEKAQRDAEMEEHQRWREVADKQRREGNTALDGLQARLEALQGQVKERQAEHDAILDGMMALGRRLRIA